MNMNRTVPTYQQLAISDLLKTAQLELAPDYYRNVNKDNSTCPFTPQEQYDAHVKTYLVWTMMPKPSVEMEKKIRDLALRSASEATILCLQHQNITQSNHLTEKGIYFSYPLSTDPDKKYFKTLPEVEDMFTQKIQQTMKHQF